jgi:hypothetical protein
MPNYHFTVQWPDRRQDASRWTNLPNNEAAIAYARVIIRDLKRAGRYDHPSLTLLVQNVEGKTISSIPLGS